MNHLNIKDLRIKKNFTQNEVAKYVGVTQAAVTKWEKGVPPKGRYLIKLCQLLGASPVEILDNHPKKIDKKLKVKLLKDIPKVPIIELQSLALNPKKEEITMIATDKKIVCPTPHGDRTFAFVAGNDCMVSATGKSYTENTIIYCDPDREAVVGDMVVARLKSNNYVVFAVLKEYCGRCVLKFLNERYPIIDEEFTIIGRVIGAYTEE